MSYLTGNLSNFPNKVDEFLEVYELPTSQKNNLARFQQLKLQDLLSDDEQNELNDLTIILQHYIISPITWNKFCDALIATQQFFLDSVEPYIENKKSEFQAEIDKLVYRGEWQPDTQYYKKNIITSGGESFIAKEDNINKAPPASAYWGKIASKGSKGDPSLNINYKGEYKNNQAYVEGDAVTFGSLWYYAKQNTLENSPTNDEYWELHSNQVLVSENEPFDNRIVGWIDTNTELYRYYDSATSTRKPIKSIAIVSSDGTKEYDANDLYEHLTDSNPHSITKSIVELGNVTNDKQMPIAGGTFTGVVKAHTNTNYEVAQVRNMILSTDDADLNSMNDGDIWIKYS